MTVYLLHFEKKIGEQRGEKDYTAHAQHYIGCTGDIEKRMRQHKSGQGCRIAAVALARGVGVELVREWPGGWELEKRLKTSYKNARLLCPVCNPTWAKRAANF